MKLLSHSQRKRLLVDKAARRRAIAWNPPKDPPPPRLSPREVATLGRRYAPRWLREMILARDGFRCRYCKRAVANENANVDHLKPWPWGMTERDNLVTSCRPCNQAKGRSDAYRWKRKAGAYGQQLNDTRYQ